MDFNHFLADIRSAGGADFQRGPNSLTWGQRKWCTVSAWRVLVKSSVPWHQPVHFLQPSLLMGAFFHLLLSKLRVKIDRRIAQTTNILSGKDYFIISSQVKWSMAAFSFKFVLGFIELYYQLHFNKKIFFALGKNFNLFLLYLHTLYLFQITSSETRMRKGKFLISFFLY